MNSQFGQSSEFSNVSLISDRTLQEDIGSLTVGKDSIQFSGRSKQMNITNIKFVSIDSPLGQFDSTDGSQVLAVCWVKVEYGEGSQPIAIYLKEQGFSGRAERIYSAMQHFPNSGQIECKIWLNWKLPFPANLNPLLALGADWKKGCITSTSTGRLRILARSQHMQQLIEEIALAEVKGFTYETLTIKQQVIRKLLDVLRWGVVTGLVMGVIVLIQQGGSGVLPWFGFLAIALGLGIVAALLVSIPNLLRIRTLDLFTINLKDGAQWNFGVSMQQSESVIQTLGSFGIEKVM